MKNGNLYKIAALMMALVLMSALGFAQEETKKEKKEKTYMIKMQKDDDGTTTVIDTIIIMNPSEDVDIDAIMEEIEVQMVANKEHMKTVHLELKAEMDELHHVMKAELMEANEEIEKALQTLQVELENLDIESEVRERINEAMKTLEEADLSSNIHFKNMVLPESHAVFVSEDGHVEVIMEGEEDANSKVLWITKDGEPGEHEVSVWVDDDGEHNVNVWVDDQGEKKVIIKKKISDEDVAFYGDNPDQKHHKMVIIQKIDEDGPMDMDLIMVEPASEKDFDKAVTAGLPLNQEQRLEDIDLNVSIEGDKDPVFGFKTGEEGKMKVTYYDENFKKIKSIKLTEEKGMHTFPLNQEELKEKKVKYMLIQQNDKADLMKL